MATVLASRPKVWTSLLRAAEELDAARSAAEIRGAIRTGLFGLEFQLDTLAKELALDPGAPGALEPVVLNRARAVEATLRSLLIEGWALLTVADVELETQTGRRSSPAICAAPRAGTWKWSSTISSHRRVSTERLRSFRNDQRVRLLSPSSLTGSTGRLHHGGEQPPRV
jgi:hypothetical protein